MLACILTADSLCPLSRFATATVCTSSFDATRGAHLAGLAHELLGQHVARLEGDIGAHCREEARPVEGHLRKDRKRGQSAPAEEPRRCEPRAGVYSLHRRGCKCLCNVSCEGCYRQQLHEIHVDQCATLSINISTAAVRNTMPAKLHCNSNIRVRMVRQRTCTNMQAVDQAALSPPRTLQTAPRHGACGPQTLPRFMAVCICQRPTNLGKWRFASFPPCFRPYSARSQ